MVARAVKLGEAVAPHVVIVTGESQVEGTRAAVPDVEMIAEPIGRNTAAAIGLAAAVLEARDPAAVLLVLPADQHVTDQAAFQQALEAALVAVERDDSIATIGITPTRAETGFGYLEITGAPVHGVATGVKRFVEKPNRATAEQYLATGFYLWNAGIFGASARRILRELDTHLAATAQAGREIAADPSKAREPYAGLPSISCDDAVMQRAERVITVPANVGWDDVGSWAALPAVRGIDEQGNTVSGQVLVLDGTGNVVLSDDQTLVATVGVSDLVVVKSGDA